jgi:LPS sulfotransferase NodH
VIIPPPLRAIASPHRQMLEALWGPLRPSPLPPGQGERFLFLCFTNRCGSNHVAQLLASTGAFNEAGEFFNADTVLEHSTPRGLRRLPDYFAALTAMLPHFGPLAMKAGIDHLVMLADTGVLDAIRNRAIFLLLERNDRLGQAISRVIAGQTGRFSTDQAQTMPDAALRYSRAAIQLELDNIERSNALFYLFFAANGITPIHTSHEAVTASPDALLGPAGLVYGLVALAVAGLALISFNRQPETAPATLR